MNTFRRRIGGEAVRPGNWLRPVAALVIAAVCCPGAPAQAPNSLPRILPAPAEEAGPALESPPGAEAPPAGPATPIPAEAQPPSPGGDVPSAGASPAATPAAAGEPWKPILLPVWEHGVYFYSPRKDFVFHIGGAVHYDAAFYGAGRAIQFNPGGVGELNDGVALRRGRLRAEGTFYKNLDFIFEMEFSNGFVPSGLPVPAVPGEVSNSPGPTDANLTFRNVPVLGNVRVGSQKEPFSLEHLNSYRFLEFMERSYLFDVAQPTAFNNGFTPGIQFFRTAFDERMTVALGVFRNDSDLVGFSLGDGQLAATGRLTFLPLYEDGGRQMIHVGGSASYRDPVGDVVLLRTRPSVRSGPGPLLNVIASTGPITAASNTLFNLESAAVNGPWTFQAEYLSDFVGGARQGAAPELRTFWFQGFYVSLLYFLTGEHRPWNRETATFGRIIPDRPLYLLDPGECGTSGIGAWEVGIRYTYLDLTDGGITGGVLNDITLGLNWYLNPNAKLQFNYDLCTRSETGTFANGTIHAFGMRMAMDF